MVFWELPPHAPRRHPLHSEAGPGTNAVRAGGQAHSRAARCSASKLSVGTAWLLLGWRAPMSESGRQARFTGLREGHLPAVQPPIRLPDPASASVSSPGSEDNQTSDTCKAPCPWVSISTPPFVCTHPKNGALHLDGKRAKKQSIPWHME